MAIDFRMVLVSASGCGKTAMLSRFRCGAFPHHLQGTIGTHFNQILMRADSVDFAVRLWDTSGLESFRVMLPLYVRRADCVLLFYDVSSIESLMELDGLMEDVRVINRSCIVAVVGNKIDLPRVVPRDIGVGTARRIGAAAYFETSALTGDGVDDVFRVMIAAVAHRRAEKGTAVAFMIEGKERRCRT